MQGKRISPNGDIERESPTLFYMIANMQMQCCSLRYTDITHDPTSIFYRTTQIPTNFD